MVKIFFMGDGADDGCWRNSFKQKEIKEKLFIRQKQKTSVVMHHRVTLHYMHSTFSFLPRSFPSKENAILVTYFNECVFKNIIIRKIIQTSPYISTNSLLDELFTEH